MRALAALAVTLYHSFGGTAEQALWAPLEIMRHLTAGGWLGVHVFFVLSGYCMAEKMFALAARDLGPGEFLRDRFWRIMPPYWLTLLLIVVLGLAAAPFNHLGWQSALPQGRTAVFADMLLLQPVFETTSLLLVSWTLMVEGGFYLLVAGLLLLWPQVKGFGGVLLIATVLMLLCMIPRVAEHNRIFSFWPEFWLGLAAYAALAASRRQAGLLLTASIGFLVWWQPAGLLGNVHLAAVATAGVLLVLHPFDGRLNSLPILRWLGPMGLWSYSLYLIHAVILSRALNLAGRWIAPESAPFGAVWVGSIALALFGAWTFYRLVEEPLERRRHELSAGKKKPA